MTSTEIQERVVDAVVIMKTAVTHLQLYPPTNAMISQTIDRLRQSLEAILDESDPLILAESEKMLIMAGEPAGPKIQEKQQIRAFVDLMVNFGVSSITFGKGLAKEELTAFLQTLSLRPEDVKAEGGVQERMDRQGILHIRIGEKVYIAKDKNQQIMASLDVQDDDIVNFLMEADPAAADLQQIREKAKDPEWITEIFQTGMRHVKEQQGSVPNMQLSDNLVQMVRMLEKVVAQDDLERIVQLVSRSVTEMDSQMISLFLSHDVREVFGGKLLEDIIEDLDEDRFAAVADGLADMLAASGERGRTAAVSLDAMMKTDKGRKLARERQIRIARAKEEQKKRIELLHERLRGLLGGEEMASIDQDLMAELPALFQELHALGDDRMVDALIERLAGRLHSRNPDVRSQSAEALSRILNNDLTCERPDQVGPLSELLAGWLKSETVFSSVYSGICQQLKELERTILDRNPFLQDNPILDILSLIQSGRSPKEPAMVALTAEALRELTTVELLDVLFRELLTKERGRQKEAAYTLGRLGITPVDRLLDILQDSEESDERVRILQIISEIGTPAIPVITARMTLDKPWYVLRNLVYVLGRVGNEAQAVHLAPIMLHENKKLQAEALKSLQRIGGKVRAETLLSILPKADDPFKMSIVEMLGTIKAVGAVPALTTLLQSKSASPLKSDLDEKICIALGNIGSEEALPALMEISSSKGFFAVRKFKEQVRLAADKAVAAITRGKS